MRRYSHRLDPEQKAIVAALRATGCSVLSLARLGGGCPDLLVGLNGTTFLIEVKAGRTPWKPVQRKFFETWRGHVATVATVDEALAVIRPERSKP